MLAVDRNTVDTFLAQDLHYIPQPCDGFEDTFGDDRLHDVELKLSCLCCKRDGSVVTDDLEAYLVGDLGNDGVHFARHDRTTRCHRGQVDLMQTAARTGRHETKVIAGLGQFDRQTFQRRRIGDIGSCVGRRLHEVGSQLKGFAREFAHLLDAKLRISRYGIQTRTDRRTAHVDLIEQFDVALEVRHFFFEVIGKGVELLSAGHRHSVLELGATHLDRVVVLVAFLAKRSDQVFEFGYQPSVHADEGIAESRRVGVVGRLSAVDMVVR